MNIQYGWISSTYGWVWLNIRYGWISGMARYLWMDIRYGSVWLDIWYGSMPNIAGYPVWLDIRYGWISSMARHPVWLDIQYGWISGKARYQVWVSSMAWYPKWLGKPIMAGYLACLDIPIRYGWISGMAGYPECLDIRNCWTSNLAEYCLVTRKYLFHLTCASFYWTKRKQWRD